MDEVDRHAPEDEAQLEGHFRPGEDIIQAEECGSGCRKGPRNSPENLEGLVKFAYFGGFIDMAGVRRFLWWTKSRPSHCWPSGTRRSGSRVAGSVKDGFRFWFSVFGLRGG